MINSSQGTLMIHLKNCNISFKNFRHTQSQVNMIEENENLQTYEGDEDVEFEFIDNDENINMMDESNTREYPQKSR